MIGDLITAASSIDMSREKSVQSYVISLSTLLEPVGFIEITSSLRYSRMLSSMLRGDRLFKLLYLFQVLLFDFGR